MNKFICMALLGLCLWALPTSAQRKAKHLVQLKNGSIIRATQVEQLDSVVRFVTSDGSIWIFKQSEVQSITISKPSITQPTRGFVSMNSLSFLFGKHVSRWMGWETSSIQVVPTINSFNGWQFHRGLTVGLGLGIDAYSRMPLIPITAGIRGDICKGNFTPYYGLDMGYALPFDRRDQNSSYKGGVVANPLLGIKRYGKHGGAFFLQMGFKVQKASESSFPTDWRPRQDFNMTYKRLAVSIGLQF